jgi:hypothetical protein
MKLTTSRLLAIATAVLALNACASEPSDWRPENKVSVDMVPPGHRVTDNFDLETPEDTHHSKGGAIEEPVSSGVDLHGMQGTEHGPGQGESSSAEAAISANAEEGMRKRGEMHDAGKSTQDDTTAGGHEVQR